MSHLTHQILLDIRRDHGQITHLVVIQDDFGAAFRRLDARLIRHHRTHRTIHRGFRRVPFHGERRYGESGRGRGGNFRLGTGLRRVSLFSAMIAFRSRGGAVRRPTGLLRRGAHPRRTRLRFIQKPADQIAAARTGRRRSGAVHFFDQIYGRRGRRNGL